MFKPCKNSEDNFIANTLKHYNVEQIMGKIYFNVSCIKD